MKGDFSRHTFVPGKHYSAVQAQQGRVYMDADVNEQAAILHHRDELTAADVIGPSGTPAADPGFSITVENGKDLQIGLGHYYVDGILCENDANVLYSAQPDYPGATDILTALNAAKATVGLAYLDVWPRFISDIEDPYIQETALGGPDTATRIKTVWQVKVLPLPKATTANAVCTDASLGALPTLSSGTMNAQLAPPATTSLCESAPATGYLGAENQLYRIEVHTGGPRATATIKWSRDNGSVATAITKIDGSITANTLTVVDTGPDQVRGFADGQWVELADDASVLGGSAYPLAQIDHVFSDQEKITLLSTPPSVSTTAHSLARRWDVADTVSLAGGVALPTNFSGGLPMNQADGGWITLENGIQITFSSGNYNVGDYWLTTARASGSSLSVGSIEWPGVTGPNVTGQPQPPLGTQHAFAPLALLQVTGGALASLTDCRNLFPALTEMTNLFYVGGDGQEGPGGKALPQPLQVGVANGKWPVPNAQLQFVAQQGSLTSGTLSGSTITVTTDANGLASATWTQDSTTLSQTVAVSLANHTGLPVNFHSQLQAQSSQALHISSVETGGAALLNDSKVLLPTILDGITINIDGDLDPNSVSRATFFIIVETPALIDLNTAGAIINSIPVFNVVVLNGTTVGKGPIMIWSGNAGINSYLSPMIDETPDKQLLARLVLKGDYIWSEATPKIYLDGTSFGAPRAGANPAASDVLLPSGNQQKGGDFQMWFWLTNPPLPTVTSVVSAPAGIDVAIGATTGTSVGTVTLSGAAPTTGAVVSLTSNNTAIVQVPATVVVAAGATTSTFTITASVANMAATTTVEISAAYNNSTQSASVVVSKEALKILNTGVNTVIPPATEA